MATMNKLIREMTHYRTWELVMYGVVIAILKVSMSFLYEPLIQHFSDDSAYRWIVLLVGLAVAQVVLMWLFLIRKNTLHFAIQDKITSNILLNMPKMRGEIIDSNDSGEWLTIMTTDIKQVAYQYAYTLPEIMTGLIGFIVALVYGVVTSWVLTSIILMISVLAIVVSKVLSHQLIHNKRVEQEEQDSFQPMIVNILQNKRLLQVYGKTPFGKEVFNRTFYRYRHAQLNRQRASIVMESVSMGTGFVLTAIWLSVAFYLIQRGELSLGEFLGFGTLNANLNWLFFSFPMFYSEYLEQEVSVERVANFEQCYISNRELPDCSTSCNQLIFDNIHYHYDNAHSMNVLENLYLELTAGDKIAIVGESGSGKSTLLKLLTGYYPLQVGTLSIDGNIVQDTRVLSQLVSYVPQKNLLFSTTLRENIVLANPCDDTTLEKIVQQTGLTSVVQRLSDGLDTLLEAGVMQNLSEGEIQRIGLARALVLKRPILILDEPTSALDSDNEQHIVNMMARTAQTVVLVTHRDSTIPSGFRRYELHQGTLTLSSQQ